MQTKHFIMFYGLCAQKKKFWIALILSMSVFNDGVRKKYSSFFKMSNLPFPEKMEESLLKVDKERKTKPKYQSKLTNRQNLYLKKRRGNNKNVESTQCKSQKFN